MTGKGFEQVPCGSFDSTRLSDGLNIEGIDDITNKTAIQSKNVIESNYNEIKFLFDSLNYHDLDDGFGAEKIIGLKNNDIRNKEITDNYIKNNIDIGYIFKVSNFENYNLSDNIPKLLSTMLKFDDNTKIIELYLFKGNDGVVHVCIGDDFGNKGIINKRYFSDISKFEKISKHEISIKDLLNFKMKNNENKNM